MSVGDLNYFAEKDKDLKNWWNNFLTFMQNNDWDLNTPETYHYPEISLSIPLNEHRLVGKFDLLVLSGEELFIFDWKTSRRKPNRARFSKYLQTRVYPFLLVKSGFQAINIETIRPAQVMMIYWFANFPTISLKFNYSDQQYKEDSIYIEKLVAEIRKLDEAPAPKTQNEVHCKFCVYRSLCNRGKQAGMLSEKELDEDLVEIINIDIEQIPEIEY
jgi:hypothetical protein